ncbi:MAG: T9SS type A sorting domain-containing protein [Janthinobacterium lividum]
MNHSLCLVPLALVLVTVPCLPHAQDLTNAGSTLTVQPGASLYVGTGGLRNASGTLTNAGTLRIDGPLTNPAGSTLDLSTGALEVRGDFTNAGTLVPGTSAVTFSGAADQLLTPGGAALYQVLVNKATSGANTLRLAGDLTVSNLLSLTSGYVTTKAPGGTVYTLSLPAGASVSGEASGRYVLGSLAITRPVGSNTPVNFSHGATLDQAPNSLGTVTITRTAGLKTTDVSYGQNVGGTAKGIDRIYTVAAATPPSAAVQLTLSWLPDDDNGLTDFTQARGWQQPAVGHPWTGVGAPANASSRSIVLTPTVLNRFTVSNAANPLPVTLLAFTAQAEGATTVRLNWATASEVSCASFTVERSLDGRSFQDVGSQPGAGTSLVRHDYTLLNTRLPAGATLLYYRLRQVDLDGTLSYSAVRTVALAAQAAGFGVYPTRVAAGQSATYYYSGPAELATLRVLDMLGRTVRELAVEGRPQGTVPLAGLATGSYVLRYTTATASFTGRCVVE